MSGSVSTEMHRVDRGQRDVQRDVAAEQVAVEVRGRAARGRREQHHADREHGRQPEQDDQPEADGRQQQDLAEQRDEHRLRMLADPGEVPDGEIEPQPEHDDAQGDGKSDGRQR